MTRDDAHTKYLLSVYYQSTANVPDVARDFTSLVPVRSREHITMRQG